MAALNCEQLKYWIPAEVERDCLRLQSSGTTFINYRHPCVGQCCMKIGFDLIKDGGVVFRTQHIDYPNESEISNPGKYEFICEIPPHLLNVGEYFVMPLLSLHYAKGLMHNFEPILSLKVTIDIRLSAFYAILNDRNHPEAEFPC